MTPNEVLEAALLSDVPANVGALLVEAQRQVKAWREVAAAIEEHLVLVMDGHDAKQFMVDGLALFQRQNQSTRRGWQHADLLRDVKRAALANRQLNVETGEVQTEAEAVAQAIEACASISAWKLEGLRRYGLDPDEYVETNWKASVRVTLAE